MLGGICLSGAVDGLLVTELKVWGSSMKIRVGDRAGGERSGLELRWYFVVMVTAAIAISYFDRQTLPVAIKAIERTIPISNQQFSYLTSAFLLAYAVMYIVGGRLLDRLGTRLGFTLIMVWWSIACALQGLATGFALLLVALLLLGMGEGGAFPAAVRVVAEWIEPEERSTAMGIINAGTAVGSVLAAPVVTRIVLTLGWRCGILCCGRGGVGVGAVVGGFLSESRDYGVVEHAGCAGAGRAAYVCRTDRYEQCADGGVCEVHERFGLVLSAALAAEISV